MAQMPEPTRCPTCLGQVEWDDTELVFRTTAPDPATVSAMRELLGEISHYFASDVTWHEVHEHVYKPWRSKIATLLEEVVDGAE